MNATSRRTLLGSSAGLLFAPALTLAVDAQAAAFGMHCGTAPNDSAGPTFYAEASAITKMPASTSRSIS